MDIGQQHSVFQFVNFCFFVPGITGSGSLVTYTFTNGKFRKRYIEGTFQGLEMKVSYKSIFGSVYSMILEYIDAFEH